MNDVFSKRLQDAIDVRGISQKELAHRTGVTEVSISRYVKGHRIPRLDHFGAICTVLDVSPDFLMGRSRGIKA